MNYEDYRKEFRENRNIIIYVVGEFFGGNTNENTKMLLKLMEERTEELKKYKKNIDLEEQRENLTNSKENILLSLIHMSCNRFKGDNVWENKIVTLTRHGVNAYLKKITNYKGGGEKDEKSDLLMC